ncbi:MAG: shikimate kinase [Prevotella sp.]|nr:shikimate kinase [Prevotella sp.]
MIRVILIGFMGAGKTTVGKALGKALGVTFYDLDWYIETRMRKTVKQIFDEQGEEGFRKMEHNMLHEVAEFENVVISCGGGTPCFYDNMDYLNQQGDTVYLKASPEVLYKHLKMAKGVRPLLLNKTPEEVQVYIREELSRREQFYSKAKHILDIDVMDSLDKVQFFVEEIKKALKDKQYEKMDD